VSYPRLVAAVEVEGTAPGVVLVEEKGEFGWRKRGRSTLMVAVHAEAAEGRLDGASGFREV
jgi:hypothetical protein